MGRWRGFAALLIWALCAGAAEPPDVTVSGAEEAGWVRRADVLYIGDSESLGYFGDNIYRWTSGLKDPRTGRPLSVWTYWTCGSDVFSWLVGAKTVCGIRTCNGAGQCARNHGPHEGPGSVRYGPVRKYLEAVQPRVTIVSLGTNFLTTREFRIKESYSYYLDRAATLVDQIRNAGSGCVWIGPPLASLHTKTADEYAAFVADLRHRVEAGSCTFIDSGPLSDRKYLLSRDPEGTHYQGEGEKVWSAGVWRLLAPALQQALAGEVPKTASATKARKDDR